VKIRVPLAISFVLRLLALHYQRSISRIDMEPSEDPTRLLGDSSLYA
ncbi:unnamed protein product, partial [Acidithrix sp. C25]